MARPRVALLEVDRIADAAIQMVDEGEVLAVVPLAQRLGVRASSLYNHVAGRADIIRHMDRRMSVRYGLVVPADVPWDEAVRAVMMTSWRISADHPRVLQLVLSIGADQPTSVDFYDQLVSALRRSGLPEEELLATAFVLEDFAFGAALDIPGYEQIPDTAGDTDTVVQLAHFAQKHPTGRERSKYVFRFGLDLLIEAIRARGT